MKDTFLKNKQVCEWLGISRNTLQRLQEQGEIAFVQIGRVRRIPTEAVEKYVQKHLNDMKGNKDE